MSRDSPSTGWKEVCEEMGVSTGVEAEERDGGVNACPECDHTNLNKRTRKRPLYLCQECRAEFNVPAKRPPRNLADRLRRCGPDA